MLENEKAKITSELLERENLIEMQQGIILELKDQMEVKTKESEAKIESLVQEHADRVNQSSEF